MTPPLTDTELLAYIERTPELRAALIAARLYANQLFEEPYIPPDTRRLARAFHANEQRVREEERKIISAGVAFIMGPGGDEGTRMGLHPDSPYRETVDEQGEAAEAVGLLREVFGAYVLGVEPECDRAALLRRVSDFLTKQGGK